MKWKDLIWISFRFSLDFLPKNLGFPSGEICISFIAGALALQGARVDDQRVLA
jgi:hypothetical protein